MIGVIAKLTIAEGKEQEFETAANALVAKVYANEDGCLLYELYKSNKEPNVYIFMEKYSYKAALDAHGKTAYFIAAQPALGACLSAAPDIQTYSAV